MGRMEQTAGLAEALGGETRLAFARTNRPFERRLSHCEHRFRAVGGLARRYSD